MNFAQPSMALEQELVDLSPNKIDRVGIKVVRPIKDNEFKRPECSFRCFRSPDGVWYGIPISKNPDGTYKFRRIHISGHKAYNLEVLADAIEWHIVKHWPRLESSPWVDKSRVMFRVDDPEAEAQVNTRRISMAKQAIGLVSELDDNTLREKARLFGIEPATNTIGIIRSLILTMAVEKPEYVVNKLEGTADNATEGIFRRALAIGLIKMSPEKGYVYNEALPIGLTEMAALRYLGKDKELLVQIDIEGKDRDKTYVANYQETQGVNLSKEEKEEDNFGDENIEEKLNPPTYSVDEEEEVRKEAKGLGISYWHVKKVENLKQEIADAKTELLNK